ncbi:hypothetical protein B0I72DRAFT_133017 [Yarrowia lipolytica]|uniref:YALI0E20405p n=2 Tax=Yarrowia lipolytica TaxID=4952 RepID=Q6C577_YARLI|nr:YALI0E20405p [Yarrowia lipolytica CLIB122]RDW28187.1 hypothetical protein B0I71DRAFT_127706 [Yarrowia lipolytica]RDW35527.1 hypothetical protein B0I72DRAFT_133017 [Yarrowia lipolytica]RDW49164.1 hypothetical protein B0I74DRAFT_132595 [Yarrowia lipolytica]RDW55946.1 hypothetical protein B0I75DRAFT_131877 [Yarrowia lipolytica]CAG79780.1 YALI0E20405p [Yarrowia lipolytica CLIB122]|eukprot:XP_504185.1 YALI0E20405p [Yarrowia lipolytica CLIB122]
MVQIIHKAPLGDMAESELFYGSIPDFMRSSRFADDDTRISVVDYDTDKAMTLARVFKVSGMLRAQFFHTYDVGKKKDGDANPKVIFYVGNTADNLACHIALHDLGAIISPASTAYDVNDLLHQINVVDAALIVAEAARADVAREAVAKAGDKFKHVKVVVFEELLEQNRRVRPNLIRVAPIVHLSKEQAYTTLAYLGMSSGTSGGVPKAVELTHFAMTSNVQQTAKNAPNLVDDDTVCSAVIPTSHIYGLALFMLHMPFLGAKVVYHKKFDLVEMLEGQKKHGVNYWVLVPPIIVALAKHPIIDRYLDSIRANLKTITSGAAPLGGNVVDAVQTRFTGNTRGTLPNNRRIVIYQGYGLTETAPIACLCDPLWDNLNVVTVGTLVPNTEARIVDENGDDQPAFEVTDARALGDAVRRGDKIPSGELYLRGPQIMSGYHKNPKSTEESFEYVDYKAEGLRHYQDRWLKTGDVAVIDNFGRIQIVDRTKELIKSMSKQVAPAELEALLLSHPDVVDVAVIGVWQEEKATESARAFLVVRDPKVDVVAIKKWMDEQVPSYKRLYGGVVVIDAIPKNPSGKILRRLLRQRKDDVVQGLDQAKL